MIQSTLPPFRPAPLLRNPHVQTILAAYYPVRGFPYTAVQHPLELADGDRVVLHDDRPPDWQPGERVALLLHGLGGCHGSPYMIRIAGKLAQRGVRVFRMDLRGCGAALWLARRPGHAGRSDDVRAALHYLAGVCPGSPVSLVGFSMSGNIVLKLMGEIGDAPPGGLDNCLAVSPPVDLRRCCMNIRSGLNRMYDRNFLRMLEERVRQLRRRMPREFAPRGPMPMRSLYDFDDQFTAPLSGFGNADEYYARSSALRLLADIRLPTRILSAADDPLIPAIMLREAHRSPMVDLHLTDHGGHLGFFAATGADPDRHWLDWRVVDWVAEGV